MDPSTISGSTFTLAKQGSSQSVAATVSYDAETKKPRWIRTQTSTQERLT